MTGDDLTTLLRTQVLSDEPPFRMSSTPFLARGSRIVRRRRILGATGVASVLTAAIVGAASWFPGDHSDRVVFPPVVQEALDAFDPATFPDTIDAEVRRAAGPVMDDVQPAWIEPTVDGYTRLRPEDYAYTDAWTASYDLSADDRLMVLLRHDPSANEGSARSYCRDNVASGELTRCEAATLPDGSVTITSVFATTLRPSGFTRARPDDPADKHWFARQVVNRRDYRLRVIAREYVKAPRLAEADRRWSLGTEQLTRIASSPRLVYKMPPEEERACNPTYLMPRRSDGFARVRCD